MSDTPTEVADLISQRASWTDDQILAEFAALSPLDESATAAKLGANYENAYWTQANLYLALTEICAVRRLKPGARLILEKAEFGDPGSIMRGIRHSLDRIYNPDWAGLAQVCIDAYNTGRPGTQIWAIDELRILQQPFARPVFEGILERKEENYVDSAINGLARLDLALEKQKHEADTDEQILTKMAAIPPVVDEADPSWTTGRYWASPTWHGAVLFEALTDIAVSRRLKPAIPLVFDKMCVGNPRTLMSVQHYGLEHIVGEDWKFLQDAAYAAYQSPRPGTRYWGYKELVWGVISSHDYPPTRRIIEEMAATGTDEKLRFEAENLLEILADRDREKAATVGGTP